VRSRSWAIRCSSSTTCSPSSTPTAVRAGGLVEGYEQVVVTAAVEEDVPAALRARTVRVVAGTIVAADADEDAKVDDE
jgi:hypothetical protein